MVMTLTPWRADARDQPARIGEGSRAPGEDPVVVHVVDVQVDHVEGEIVGAIAIDELFDGGVRVVAPAALLMAERPARRQRHVAGQVGIARDHLLHRGAPEEVVVELRRRRARSRRRSSRTPAGSSPCRIRLDSWCRRRSRRPAPPPSRDKTGCSGREGRSPLDRQCRCSTSCNRHGACRAARLSRRDRRSARRTRVACSRRPRRSWRRTTWDARRDSPAGGSSRRGIR